MDVTEKAVIDVEAKGNTSQISPLTMEENLDSNQTSMIEIKSRAG